MSRPLHVDTVEVLWIVHIISMAMMILYNISLALRFAYYALHVLKLPGNAVFFSLATRKIAPPSWIERTSFG